MPLLYTEGIHSFAVRLLDVWNEDEFVYLKIQDLQTNKTFNILWNLGYRGEY